MRNGPGPFQLPNRGSVRIRSDPGEQRRIVRRHARTGRGQRCVGCGRSDRDVAGAALRRQLVVPGERRAGLQHDRVARDGGSDGGLQIASTVDRNRRGATRTRGEQSCGKTQHDRRGTPQRNAPVEPDGLCPRDGKVRATRESDRFAACSRGRALEATVVMREATEPFGNTCPFDSNASTFEVGPSNR